MKHIIKAIVLCFLCITINAQTFTREDSLRGAMSPERTWWDLIYYHLEVEVKPEEKFIVGQNTISYKVLENHHVMQIDLQSPLKITKITDGTNDLKFERDGNAHFVVLNKDQVVGETNKIIVQYEGHPREAKRAPWDGGFSWKKDAKGDHFIATSCQGLGASVWWPCKDHMYDEVEGMKISVEVPQHLKDVSNGRLIGVDRNKKKKTRTFHWEVTNPINNYGVNLNIGNYVTWHEVYAGEKGDLDVSYWALAVDEAAARKQYTEVPRMLKAFENWFGPYPFYEDGYQLVQAPYLGMEHQSSITYGNRFANGYLGRDLSTTGWGLKFDFIIIHESGHEWFANNVTHKDMADMWIHESFTNYSESLFVEYYFGKEAGQEYVRGTRANIQNLKPMIGTYGVNDETYPGDVYYKGANILNTLRTVLDDDEKWRSLLRGINQEFYHQTIDSKELEAYIAEQTGMELQPFFNQYLRDSHLPILEYYFKDGALQYRWTSVNEDFDMPLDIMVGEEMERIYPSTNWKQYMTTLSELEIEPNYYIGTLRSR